LDMQDLDSTKLVWAATNKYWTSRKGKGEK
jgi:hypothetical protein